MDEDEDEDLDEIVDVPFDEEELDDATQVYKTYKMDYLHKRIGGMIDDKDACMQAIWKILQTIRYANMIYDDQYGCDVFNRINDPGLTNDYLETDVPVMIREALTADERILDVTDFTFNILSSDSVHMQFTAQTIYGDLDIEGVVNNGD